SYVFYRVHDPRDLHSFPTRRSSDLFISAMDTDRIREWNAWYHLMNCGFPVKASGETDFPCMSGTRVGQGRSYVQLGQVAKVDYADRKSTRLNSSHDQISYAVFCLKK